MKCLFPLLLFFCFSVLGGPSDSISRIIEKHIDRIEQVLPVGQVLFENNIGDVSLCTGPDNISYLTGTFGDKTGVNQGIMVWASRDMKEWNLVGRNNGYVWTFEHDASSWQKEISIQNGWKRRSIVAPKIFYIKGSFWITYTNTNTGYSSILKSVTGRAQGPYKDVSEDKALVIGENASLFEDSDGSVYFLWGNGFIRRMNDEMNGFADTEARFLTDLNGNRLPLNGISIVKIDNRYVLSGSAWSSSGQNKNQMLQLTDERFIDNRYDGVVAISKSLFSNYQLNLHNFPHAGGGQLFHSPESKLYYAFSGVDAGNPMAANPTLLPVESDSTGQFFLKYRMPGFPEPSQNIVYVSYNGNNSNGASWANAFTSIQRAIESAMHGSQIWIARGTYDGPVDINLREGLYFFGGFKGDETDLGQRDCDKYKVIITGRNAVKNVVSIKNSTYIRIDGITIQGGNASGGSLFQQYGGGVHILGGGETIRLVNCHFENNKANQDGGGLYASIGAAPLVINCSFKNNVALNNGGGAAIYANTSNGYKIRFYNCIFNGNTSYSQGGAIFFESNKMDFGMLHLANSLVINNQTLGENGTIALNGNASMVMSNSTLCFNKGISKGAVIGSLGKVPAKTRIYNSIFYYNSGGMLFTIEGESENIESKLNPNIWVQFINCVFDQNNVNALVQRNFDKKSWRDVEILNKSVMGQNCSSGDPLFLNHFEGDYRLKNGSSALQKGSSSFYFDFDMDGKLRRPGSINAGCY